MQIRIQSQAHAGHHRPAAADYKDKRGRVPAFEILVATPACAI
jgi:hypothetical protein